MILCPIPNYEILCYDDDTALMFHCQSRNSVHEIAMIDIRNITAWLNQNPPTLNAEKTQFLNFLITSLSSPPTTKASLKRFHTESCIASDPNCNCDNIQKTNSLRYLGIILDHNLNFRKHIALTAGRVGNCIFRIIPIDFKLLYSRMGRRGQNIPLSFKKSSKICFKGVPA